MATKFYCDLCEKEITSGELVGRIIRTQETFPFGQIINQQSKVDLSKQISTEVLDLCEDCQKVLWEFVEQRKKELVEEGKKK